MGNLNIRQRLIGGFAIVIMLLVIAVSATIWEVGRHKYVDRNSGITRKPPWLDVDRK